MFSAAVTLLTTNQLTSTVYPQVRMSVTRYSHTRAFSASVFADHHKLAINFHGFKA